MKLISILDLPWPELETRVGELLIKFKIEDNNIILFLPEKKIDMGIVTSFGEIVFNNLQFWMFVHEMKQLKFDIQNWIQCQLQLAYARQRKQHYNTYGRISFSA